ncbi:unnamed protein product [Gordionus sp. m RMFG-2023]
MIPSVKFQHFVLLLCSASIFGQRYQQVQKPPKNTYDRNPLRGGVQKPPRVTNIQQKSGVTTCKKLIAGKFCKDPSSYPKAKELSSFGKSQTGRSLFIVDDPIFIPPVVRYCKEIFEVLAPRWALNVNGEGRYIVQNEDFEQKILFKYCSRGFSGLGGTCYDYGRCDQQYYNIQLRVYDEINGIFSDWFQIPSGCYCQFN